MSSPASRPNPLSFLVTIYGLISGADTALLSHESQQRMSENDLRREARIDLARRGLVATESQIMKWKDEHKRGGFPANPQARG